MTKQTIKCGTYIVEHAKLTGSHFTDVCLGDAKFENVSLANSKFHDVNMSNACLDYINMANVEITDSNIKGMKINGILVQDLLDAYNKQ